MSASPPEDLVVLEWRDGAVRLLDQTRLPETEAYLLVRTPEEMANAIRCLAVRGAPLLGVAAGFGMALAAGRSPGSPQAVLADLEQAAAVLVASRPTAVNLAWAVERVLAAAREAVLSDPVDDPEEQSRAVRGSVLREAMAIALQEEASCEAIGRFGADLVPAGANVLTHCNTGALATGGQGTALGVIVAAHRLGRQPHVWVDETRPLLQGARLTAWELRRLGIPMTLVADTAAGSLMARGLVDVVLVGADRIAGNGDVANKVGTYQLAVLARHHGIPFHVAAPCSTIDLATPAGERIAIEERDPDEVTRLMGVPIAPPGTPAANPAFDLTPASLISSFVTDRGVARPPFAGSLRQLVAAGSDRGGRVEPMAPEAVR